MARRLPLNLSDCQLLGVSQFATPLEIKTAFRIAAKRLHPDTAKLVGSSDGGSSSSSSGSAAFIKLTASYERLLTALRQGCPEEQGGGGSAWGHEYVSEAYSVAQPPSEAQLRRGAPRTWAEARRSGKRCGETGPAVVSVATAKCGEQGQGGATALAAVKHLCGRYEFVGEFNRRPSYMFCHQRGGSTRGSSLQHSTAYYLFWSEAFEDWKIAERMTDTGLCLAYLGGVSRAVPWQSHALAAARSDAPMGLPWSVWDLHTKSYIRCWLYMSPLSAAGAASKSKL